MPSYNRMRPEQAKHFAYITGKNPYSNKMSY